MCSCFLKLLLHTWVSTNVCKLTSYILRLRDLSTLEASLLSFAPWLEMQCLADFEAHAKSALGSNAWGYYSSGANQEKTLRDNVEAFARCNTC